MTDLRALLTNASGRPWERDPRVVVIEDDHGSELAFRVTLGDAALIVALVNAADDLIEVAEAARLHLIVKGEHHWRCEYRTAAKGWKKGDPPVIDCECGLDDLDAALAALDARLAEENK